MKNEESVPEDKAYVNITQNEKINSCHSSVGRTGSIQPIEISGCSAVYMILHEFVHALGTLLFIAERNVCSKKIWTNHSSDTVL